MPHHKGWIQRALRALVWLPLVLKLSSQAAMLDVWKLGVDDDPYAPNYNATLGFSGENGANDRAPGLVTRLPGDPRYNAASNPGPDDDYYFAGVYPIGFNGLTNVLTVPNAEPATAFERALTTGDRTNRIHFILNKAQASATSRLRLSMDLVWGGFWIGNPVNAGGVGFGDHDITVRWRTAKTSILLWQGRISKDTRINVDVSAPQAWAVEGANTVEIIRTGPDIANKSFWVQFDFVRLEADTEAFLDDDHDGLPRWWEDENHLSDSNPADAGSDLDHDGLTALQEYNNGANSTDPNQADTDHDGLSDAYERALGINPLLADSDGDLITDGDEVRGAHPSYALTQDSDGDGASDPYELRVGTDPMNANSRPNVFKGAVGLHFVSVNDPEGVLATNIPAGVVPQIFWNETKLLNTWNQPAGGMSDIARPTAGRLTRSDGQPLDTMSVSWTSENAGSTFNRTSADGRLFDGFLNTQSGASDVVIGLQNIPFARFDLYVYVGGPYRDQHGVVSLAGMPGSERLFRSMSTPPQTRYLEVPTGDTNRVDGTFIHYTNLSSSALTINLKGIDGSVGIHAIQLVDINLDNDASGIPDWYEMLHQLEPASAALAAADSDGDGLTNIEEYRRGTDPWRADTDGDGLTDKSEPAGRASNMDGDGDGLSDADELSAVLPSDPNKIDTDGDGWTDAEERQHHSDPAIDERTLPGFAGFLPRHMDNPTRWDWDLPNVQIVWDHSVGALGGQLWSEENMLTIGVSNGASQDGESIGFHLRHSSGALSYMFVSNPQSAFSGSASPGSGIYYTDPSNPPLDLKPDLGFSGYGPRDISDRLRFHFLASRGSSNSWSLTFEIWNQSSGLLIASRSFQQCTAADDVDTGAVGWMNFEKLDLWPSFECHTGVRVFVSPTPIESLPALAGDKDSDNDGMPDVYESAHGLNPLSAADAFADSDGDGVVNRAEWLAGTDPRRPDTDQDGLNDRLELFYGSNPADTSSRPPLTGIAWPTGEDLDGDGLSDVWQARFNAFGVDPQADPDMDGVPNIKEAAAGTNPWNPDSKPSLSLAFDRSDALLTWPRLAGKSQELFVSTNLVSWTLVNEPVSTDGTWFYLRLTNRVDTHPSEFFALVTGDLDLDGDGLSDWAEDYLASDPLRADSMALPTPRVDAGGHVNGAVSGDYAAFVERFMRPGRVLTRTQAARLLQQATFGPTPRELDRLQAMGVEAWLEDQMRREPTLHRKYIETVYADLQGPRTDLSYGYNQDSFYPYGSNGQTAFARAAVSGADQLRQRVAFALSQILVISRRDPNLDNRPLAMADYYDIFVKNAFGNYRDIVRAVSLHPLMGRYLSHVGNQKARPEINQYPDENYAREIMQLFTIGLWELNQDGTRRTDSLGAPIPTYGTREITELARVFTGLWFGGQNWGWNGWSDEEDTVPMEMWPDKHDFGSKTLPRGFVIPSRAASPENGMRDVDDAIGFLIRHPNTAPFLSRQLIQFLVTSNPSKAYVARVAEEFVDNGSGVRGDLGAVVRAILLDPEARDPRSAQADPGFGRLKEPVQRAMAIARVGQLDRHRNLLWWDWGNFYNDALQAPGYAPSVFNFFRPSYSPPGLLSQAGLVAPVFQITQSSSCISFPNLLWHTVSDGFMLWNSYQFAPDYTPLLALATRPTALVDELNLLLCGGEMTTATRDTILDAVQQVSPSDPLGRVRLAVYLSAAVPEGAVQR